MPTGEHQVAVARSAVERDSHAHSRLLSAPVAGSLDVVSSTIVTHDERRVPEEVQRQLVRIGFELPSGAPSGPGPETCIPDHDRSSNPSRRPRHRRTPRPQQHPRHPRTSRAGRLDARPVASCAGPA